MERLLAVNKVRLSFPIDGNRHYKIEVSPDQIQWKLFIDESRINVPGRI